MQEIKETKFFLNAVSSVNRKFSGFDNQLLRSSLFLIWFFFSPVFSFLTPSNWSSEVEVLELFSLCHIFHLQLFITSDVLNLRNDSLAWSLPCSPLTQHLILGMNFSKGWRSASFYSALSSEECYHHSKKKICLSHY